MLLCACGQNVLCIDKTGGRRAVVVALFGFILVAPPPPPPRVPNILFRNSRRIQTIRIYEHYKHFVECTNSRLAIIYTHQHRNVFNFFFFFCIRFSNE